ncbi:MAG TPA: FAD-dependent oxidoreductase [Candidatus Gallibacteroides avistercoris]|uniref:FAD-dependent oxidoreductase n=1 Tax=Candidatus Gallibacteroides avistercoris TaxID=2840833 RepID=A0A9D1M5Z2_9BACT|nr:FAD-dependent oxidoreductase [Candidatus Gallibacteroides avistercoris]
MQKIITFILSAILMVNSGCVQQELECDVCVYGGTSAGVIAAYAVAKQGKKVLLIEPGYRLGGMSSGGLGQTDIGNKQVVKGLALDFYRRVGAHYNALEYWIFEPSVAEAVFKDYIKRGNVEVIYGHRIINAKKEGTQITSIGLENVKKFFGRTNVKAKMFIDCSYEGDLLARAGVSYTVGRESNDQYNETWNGVQMLDKHQFPDGVDPYVEKGNPESGLLWGISDAKLAEKGSGDKMVQAYNFRICLTDVSENSIPIARPADYDSTKYELLLRLIEAKKNSNLYSHLQFVHMPNRKTDINNNGGFSTDMIGMNHHFVEASYREREKIIEAHKSYTLGLLWFLGNDTRVPEKIRKEMLRWRLPKDEYVEYDNWTPQLYIREARRMVGEYVATQANCENRETVDDGIGMAAYTMDSHNCQRVVIEKEGKAMVKNEGDVQIHGGLPYDISYRSITPKREECTNLLVPVCLSASHIAYGSIRMEPVFMLLAQSAAKAACLAIDKGTKVQEVDVKEIQRMYQEDPLLDGSTPDILVDDIDIELNEADGWHRIQAGNGYGRSYILLNPTSSKKRLRFPFEVKEEGRYTVYTYYIRRGESSKVTEIIVGNGKEEEKVKLDAKTITVKGQTSGEWVPLGEYDFQAGDKCYVDFTNNGEVTGQICADAILAVKNR